jgi:hypothetical protein
MLHGVDVFPSDAMPLAPPSIVTKRATILDQDDDSFAVEYDTTIGTKNTMRLESTTYEKAIEETKSFLGVTEDHDEHGDAWEIE